MHLLVLSAFRPYVVPAYILPSLSQCTFWCSVLSDRVFRLIGSLGRLLSQCTFWCSVLSDRGIASRHPHHSLGLNAPSGAQCFPTLCCGLSIILRVVSMHLLVLSAFRHSYDEPLEGSRQFQVSMHLLVLSAFRPQKTTLNRPKHAVSMHLLVLSAFRLSLTSPSASGRTCVSMHLLVLSAFRLVSFQELDGSGFYVSMHLLVLSAFRHQSTRFDCPRSRSQCTFWCSVLSDLLAIDA